MRKELFYKHHPKHEPDPVISPSDKAPPWAIVLHNQLVLVLKEVREMRQSTSDLIDVANALIANSAKVDTAIDALVQAQAGGDDDAIKAQITALQGLKSDQDTHLAKLATAAPAAVAAPADASPVNVAPTT